MFKEQLIRNLKLTGKDLADKMWNWTPLNNCFERNIRVMDIDGFVEVHGRFLCLEGKTSGVDLPRGQERALYKLSKLKEFTVIIFWGQPPNMQTIEGWQVVGKETYAGSFEEFVEFIRQWFIWADKTDL